MALLKNPLILALDVDSKEDALKILHPIADLVGGIKVGPRLIYRYGASFVTELSKRAPVFVDNKYFDIPSTMVSAVLASFEAGATLVTVHAMAGGEALGQLAILEKELSQIRPFKILAVTILTSWDQSSMPKNFQTWPVNQHVQSLAQLISDSGLSGLVCSGHELQLLNFPHIFKVTPGIRLDTEVSAEFLSSDQKRVMTPAKAIKEGADALVIGRPILQSKNSQETVRQILESCS
jgi:orotidine-5'-phosphate decarboxylase